MALKRILVVDDEFSIVEALTDLLSSEGYVTASAPNGQRALAEMRANKPDVVLLDLMMPVMDGAQTVAEMRADPNLEDIPVVLMTAADHKSATERPGYDAYLPKPFDISTLLDIIARVSRRS